MATTTVRGFARMFELDPARVSDLIRQGMPAGPSARGPKGRQINIRAACDWIAAREAAKVTASDGGESLVAAELRKARADADLAELKATSLANSSIGRDDVQELLDRVLDVAGEQLERLPGMVAKAIAETSDPATVRAIVFDATRRVRVKIAAQLEPV